MAIVSKNEITLKLIPGKKWHTTAGFIIAKSVNIGGKTYPLAATEGKHLIPCLNCLYLCYCYCFSNINIIVCNILNHHIIFN